jgi:putative ABC transport system substrate-binding protein
MMHGREKSRPVIVAGKPANKGQPETVTAAESVERRTGAEGNANQPATNRTQSRTPVAAARLALARIRQAALPDSQDPRWEPYAGKLHVRNCAGGAGQLASLPRLGRRDFITLLGGAAATWPLAGRAQPIARRQVVAFVHAVIPPAEMAGLEPVSPLARAFVHGLRDLGWIEGRTVIIERRSAEGEPQRAPAIFTELVTRGVDVIAMGGSAWLREAAQQATRTIPTVVLFDADPVAEGVVPSLARPGGNLTGVTISTGGEFIGKRLQLLKELAPAVTRVACIASSEVWESYRRSTAAADIPPVFAPVDRSEQFDEAFATILRERADALVTEGSPIIYVQRGRMVAFAAEHRLPLAANNRESVEEGGLMAYGVKASGMFSNLADYVDRILKGVRPSDLPIQRPTRFELVINLKTATALGLTIPPSLFALADEVIE